MADPDVPEKKPVEGEVAPAETSNKEESGETPPKKNLPIVPPELEPDGPPLVDKKGEKKRRRKKIAKIVGIITVILIAAGLLVWKMQWYRPVWNRFNRAAVTFKVKQEDNAVIKGALVMIDGHSVTTDENGSVYLSDLVAGSKTVTVTDDGYIDLRQTVSLKRGENDAIILILKKQTAKMYTVKGYVQDYVSGLPLVNVQVTIGDKTQITNPNGEFTFTKQLAGEVNLVMSADGYSTQTVKETITDSDLTLTKLTLVPNGKIIFVSNQSGKRDLYTVGYDGVGAKPLLQTRGDGENFAPMLSPDRKYILFSSTRDKIKDNYGSDLARLYVANSDGTNVHKVSDDVSANFSPLWSPAGDRLYYYGYTSPKLDQGAHRVYDVGQNKLIDIGDDAAVLIFSPDGTTVAYEFTTTQVITPPTAAATASPSTSPTPTPTSDTFGATVYTLKTFNMVSGERKTVATRDQYISEIRYSSNGKSISYDTIVNNTRSRFQVGIDGTGEVAVPLLPFSSRKYTLSPDGTQMAFVEERDGKTDLYVVTKDETNEKRLTRVGVVNPSFSPTWDSTSKYLTFAVRREAEVALYVVGVNGGEPRKITDYYEATTTSL